MNSRALWILGLAAFLIAGFAVGEPLIFAWAFDGAPPSGTLDAAAIFGAMIGLLALGIAAYGYGAWKLLESRVREEAVRSAHANASFATSEVFHSVGYIMWKEFDEQQGSRIQIQETGTSFERRNLHPVPAENTPGYRWLTAAIRLAESAYDHAEILDESNLKAAERKGVVLNNLLFYLAERGHPNDKQRAIQLAGQLGSYRARFPDRARAWTDTLAAVQNRWGE